MLPPTSTVGLGLIVIVLFAVAVPQAPPIVVKVNVTEAGADNEAVYVVLLGLLPELLVKLPPAAPSDQMAEVAPPVNDPPKAEVVPP